MTVVISIMSGKDKFLFQLCKSLLFSPRKMNGVPLYYEIEFESLVLNEKK
jgi:hypothetical protein